MAEGKHKFEEYELPYGTTRSTLLNSTQKDAGVNNPESRHRDKVLDQICDTHPGSPEARFSTNKAEGVGRTFFLGFCLEHSFHRLLPVDGSSR